MRNFILPIQLVLCTLSASAVEFQVGLDTQQEVPAPNVSGTCPEGSAIVTFDTISGQISVTGSYSGMTSSVSGAHIHGIARRGTTAGVIIALSNTGGTTGTFSGSGTLDKDQISGLLQGRIYLNVHTGNNGAGEIRGQIVDPDIQVSFVDLDRFQEIPAPNLNGISPFGIAAVVLDYSTGRVEISGEYSGMSTNVSGSHLHAPAGRGETAGVAISLTNSGGTAGTFSGVGTLSGANFAALAAGRSYLNLHTSQNMPGEIRGQVPGFRDPAIPFQVRSIVLNSDSSVTLTFPSAPGRTYQIITIPDLVNPTNGEFLIGAEGATETTATTFFFGDSRAYFVVFEF